MILEVLNGLAGILGSVASLSRDRRELRDRALRAISTALNETYLYYRDMNRGIPRNLEREAQLVNYWSAAAIPMRHFDIGLSEVCEHKSSYWLNPENYSEEEIDELGIRLENVRQEYRDMLYPRRRDR